MSRGRGHVLQGRVDEPEPVVRELRADALAARLVPPVLDVAFDELARRGMEDVVARQMRRRHHQRQHVLQLIAEAERAARLIEGGASPDAAGQRLVEQPAVEHQVHRSIRRRDLHRAEQRAPEALHILEGRGDSLRRAAAPHERRHAGFIGGFAEQADHGLLLRRLQRDADLYGAARVHRRAGAVREARRARAPPGREASRCGR